MTPSRDSGHLRRAMLEAHARAVAHRVEVLNAMGHGATRIIASGVGSAGPVWTGVVAGVLGRAPEMSSRHLGPSVVRPDPAPAADHGARRRASGRGGPA